MSSYFSNTLSLFEAKIRTMANKELSVPIGDFKDLRRVFRTTPLPEMHDMRGHDHGECAGERQGSRAFLISVVEEAGYAPYFFQKANNTVKGSNVPFWASDNKHDTGIDDIPEHAVFIIIDDPYINASQLCASTGRPVVVYDPAPAIPANGKGDYHWTTNVDDTMTFTACGGGTFTHKVYDYTPDTLVVPKYVYGLETQRIFINLDKKRVSDHHIVACFTPFGGVSTALVTIPRILGHASVVASIATAAKSIYDFSGYVVGEYVTTLVDSTAMNRLGRPTNGEKLLKGAYSVGITEITTSELPSYIRQKISQLAATPTGYFLVAAGLFYGLSQVPRLAFIYDIKELQFMSYGEGTFARIDQYSQKQGLLSHIAKKSPKCGLPNYATETVETTRLEAAISHRINVGKKIGTRALAIYLDDEGQLPIIAAYVELAGSEREGTGERKVTPTVPPSMGYTKGAHLPGDKIPTVGLMRGLFEPSYNPLPTLDNEKEMIKVRVKDKINTVACTPEHLEMIEEYVTYLIENARKQGIVLTQDTPEEIGAKITNPRTKAKFKQWEEGNEEGNKRIKSFGKNEGMNKPKATRLVSTLPYEELFAHSVCFSPLHDVIAAAPFYGFKPPGEIEDKIESIFQLGGDLEGCDFTAFDGTKGPVQTKLFEVFAIRCWRELGNGEAVSADFMRLLRKALGLMKHRKACTPLGVKYDTLNSTLSGHKTTSDENTVDNGFNAYCAVRMFSSSVEKACEALDKGFMGGGDDGLFSNKYITYEQLEAAAKISGLTITRELFPSKEIVQFLGRYFALDAGGISSCADPKRGSLKLTSTPARGRKDKAFKQYALYLKCLALLVTDKYTFVLGDFAEVYCKAYCRKFSLRMPKSIEVIKGMFKDQQMEFTYNNALGAWRQDPMSVLHDVMEDIYEEFDSVAFHRFLYSSTLARDPVSYLTKGPGFYRDVEDHFDPSYEFINLETGNVIEDSETETGEEFEDIPYMREVRRTTV